MKALKEKRLSLRSCLRRGLVILSLFALAFAFASCNSSDDEGGGGGGGTDNYITTVVTTRPAVNYIRITSQPKKPSFQGAPPEIDDVTIEYTIEGDNSIKTLSGADIRKEGFTPSPDYCDIPGKGTAAGKFFIAYAGFSSSNRLEIPGVIAYNDIKTNGPTLDVFSDQPADLSAGLTFTATYFWDDTDEDTRYTTVPPSTAPIGKQGNATRTIYPKKLVYPPVALPKDVAKASKQVAYAYFGLNYVNTAGTDNYWVYDTLETARSSGINEKRVEIPITYWEIWGVVLNSLPQGTYLLDDDTDYSHKTTTVGATTVGEPDIDKWQSKIVDLLAGAKFDLYYVNAKNEAAPAAVSPRTIGWDEFQKNVAYALKVATFDNYTKQRMIIGDDGIKLAAATARDKTPILNYNEDEGDPVWGLDVQYVPREYAISDDADVGNLYTAKVKGLNIPVYLFNQEIGVSRKLYPSVEVNARATWQAAPATFPARLENGINDRWTLTASYIRGSDPKTKTIAGFQSAWFYAAMSGVSNKAGTTTLDGSHIDLTGTGQFSGRVAGVASGLIISETWTLPLTYRGVKVSADDETVVVDLEYRNF